MMRSLILSQLATVLHAQHLGDDVTPVRVCTDTRHIQPGDLFVALRGERYDAHDFLPQAVEAGAIAVVVETAAQQLSAPQLVVSDTLKALGQIAAWQRQAFTGPVIAITGSSGKTTVKTLLAGILQQAGSVLATEGNLNNHIGVPLTLLRLAPEHDYAVIEMGASGPGEIAYLCALASPDIAVINNVMPAHLEGFGSLEGVAAAKGEIYGGLSETGTAVINLDDAFAERWLALPAPPRHLTFSRIQDGADFYAQDITASAQNQTFTLVCPLGEIRIQLPVAGAHNISNALAAAACAYAAGISLEKIQTGLENFVPVSGRMSRYQTAAGAWVIDDSYNANPGSVRAAIDVLAAQPGGQRVLVLGDMAELGEEGPRLHADVGAYAKTRGIENMLTCGILSEQASAAFGRGATHFTDSSTLITALEAQINAHTCVLIKGSRSARMDRVVSALIDSGEQH